MWFVLKARRSGAIEVAQELRTFGVSQGAFNASTWESEAGRLCNSRPGWSTKLTPRQLERIQDKQTNS